MRAVHIYDFDGTLFRTPQRPNWYDNNLDGVWHQNPLSFAEPCLPKGERWVKSIVSEAKRSIASKDVYTIVLTGRKTPFQRVVEDLLSSKGLKFDEVILKDRGDTESFKNRVIDRLMTQFPGAEIHIWEDRHNHLKVFMDHIEMRGGVGIPHAVPQNYSVAECSEEEFRNMRRSASETIRNLESRIARLERTTNKRAKTASRALLSKVDDLRYAFEDCAKELHQMYDEFDGNPAVKGNEELEWMSGDLYSHLSSISDNRGDLNFDVRSLFSRLENLVLEVEEAQELYSKMTRVRVASSSIRRSADKVLKAMKEMERELEKMPSFRGDVEDRYYADLAERWYTLSMRVEEEVKHIAGAY